MAQLHIRPIDDDAAERIRRSARNRGLTLGEYVARLEQLHQSARDLERHQMSTTGNSLVATAGLALPTE